MQSIALGCFPRITVQHQSKKVEGQVYVPLINWLLMVLAIGVVAGFQSPSAIGHAYGEHSDLQREHKQSCIQLIGAPSRKPCSSCFSCCVRLAMSSRLWLSCFSLAVLCCAAGITVNTVMLFTTLLLGIVMLVAWGCSLTLTLLFVLPTAFIEGAFLSSNLLKVEDGGWFSLAVATCLSLVAFLWWWGATAYSDHKRM